MRPLGTFSQFYQTVNMETMTVTKFRLQLWLCISKFYDCTKFQYPQVAEEKVLNYQFFVFDQLKGLLYQVSTRKALCSVRHNMETYH